MKKIISILFVPLLVVAMMAGCGDPKVTGKVTFPDGTPLTKGQVMFQKDGFIGSGDIKQDGSYSAGKTKDGDGLPPGQYQVFINGATTLDLSEAKAPAQDATEATMSRAAPTFRSPKPIDLIASKYMSPKSSGLTVEVKGRTKYDIKVEPPK